MHIAWCMSLRSAIPFMFKLTWHLGCPCRTPGPPHLKIILDVDESYRASLQRSAALHDFVYRYFWVAASPPCCPPRRWWASLGWASL